ncbi:MAG: hypothetical protein HOP29_11095 [Phycisphaerales bacterium]|nr:hypothetical protein [Phycisphaerales bacterium]
MNAAAPGATVLHEFRRRMACVGKLVRDLCGLNEDTDPRLVVRDAYLVVVSEIIHAIATADERLPTDELAALSKALAEHRRLDQSQMELERKSAECDGSPVAESDRSASATSRHSQMPATLDEAVKDLYGTNLSRPAADAESQGE